MEDRLQQYCYLWDGSEPYWVLLNTAKDRIEGDYLIFNEQSQTAKIIEDDILSEAVIGRMLDAGVRVVSLPR